MYLFKGRQELGNPPKDGTIFNVEEIKEAIKFFSYDTALIPLHSGSGLITSERLSSNIAYILGHDTGRIDIADLVERLDVPAGYITAWQQDKLHVAWKTADQTFITDAERAIIANDLADRAKHLFADLKRFLLGHKLDYEDHSIDIWLQYWAAELRRDIRTRDAVGDSVTAPIHRSSISDITALETPNGQYLRMNIDGGPYLIEETKLRNIEESIRDELNNATSNSSLSVFSSQDFPDLPSLGLQWLVELVLQDDRLFSGVAPRGSIHTDAENVYFISREAAITERNTLLGPFLERTVPYVSLLEWEAIRDIIPGLYSDRKGLVEDLPNLLRDPKGALLSYKILGDHIVLDAYIQQLSCALQRRAKLENSVNLQTVISEHFPSAIRSSMVEWLKCEASKPNDLSDAEEDTRLIGSHLLNKEFVRDITSTAAAQTRRLAEEIGAAQAPVPSSKLASAEQHRDELTTRIISHIDQEESNTAHKEDLESVVRLMWDKDIDGFLSNIKTIFTSTIESRSKQSIQSFIHQWQDRVASKVQLYAIGLSTLEDSALKQQLTGLLDDHITKELVPQTLKRARERELLLDATLSKQTSKLAEKLKESRDLTSTIQRLDNFAKKLNMPTLVEADLTSARNAQVQSLAQAVGSSTTDGPRSFLCAVLVFFATKRNGLLYATGKFAPKVLKLLAAGGELEMPVVELMETFKEEVKKGAVQKETIDLVATALQRALGNV